MTYQNFTLIKGSIKKSPINFDLKMQQFTSLHLLYESISF